MKKIKVISVVVLMSLLFTACNNASAISNESITEASSIETEATSQTIEEETIVSEEPVSSSEESSEETTEPSIETSETEPEIDPNIITDLPPQDDLAIYMVDGKLDLAGFSVNEIWVDAHEGVVDGHNAYIVNYGTWKVAIYYASSETRRSQEVPVYRIQSCDGLEEYEVYMVTDNEELYVLNSDYTIPYTSAEFITELKWQVKSAIISSGSCPFDGEGRWYAVSVTPTSWN